jgi:hypothetical protein
MKLSILIVNWKSKDYLRECLLSIRSTRDGLTLQIIVVDGGSFDGCAEMVTGEFPEVDFVQSPTNVGFGRSNNLGFQEVTGEAVLLLNPDTELMPGALKELMSGLLDLPDAGLIGARLLNSDRSLQLSSVHSLPTPWNAAVDSDWLRRRWWRIHGPLPGSKPVEVEAVSGACMLLSSEVFRRLGGFDPRYFMYAEDMDLCLRVRRSGLKVYHAPRAMVLHHGGGSSKTQFNRFSVVMIREAIGVYFRSNFGCFQAVQYRLLIGGAAAARILPLLGTWLVAGKANRNTRWESILKWWAVVRWSLGMESWAAEFFRMDTMNYPDGTPATS